jgi:adenylate cyclase
MNVLLRGDWEQRVRLAAGLVLLTFAGTHFLNHAMGLVSLDAMEEMQTLRFAVTRSLIGRGLIIGALIVHVGLALVRLARRRTLRMPAWEALQIATGLLIPFLLIPHVVGTWLAAMQFDIATFYAPTLARLWPGVALKQSLLLLLVWVHGCIGLHFWLRLSPGYRRLMMPLFALAVALPVLAIAGFAVQGRTMAEALAKDPGLLAAYTGDRRASLAWTADQLVWLYGLILACIAGLMIYRRVAAAPKARFTVTYPGGRQASAPVGMTLLEASRLNDIPHTSVCGGRARCSTCRVRVEQGGENLPPPRMGEAITLGSIGAPAGIRLACQIRPTRPLTVTPLVAATRTSAVARVTGEPGEAGGVERRLAVMFLDLRDFTRMSEKRLPYDVVFLLNRFFTAVGRAIREEGGWIDKYLGDGLMAVFGRETGSKPGSAAALRAARAIDLALDRVNAELAAEAGAPLRVGIGIHVGTVVVGRIGDPETATITVIGSTVNVASRLESLTKEHRCQLVVSRAVARAANWDGAGVPTAEITVRGLTAPLEVLLIERARDLPLLAPAGRGEAVSSAIAESPA